MTNQKRIYLAGSVYSDSDSDSLNWKIRFRDRLFKNCPSGIEYILTDPNPIRELDPLHKGMINYDVVGIDKRTIDNSDYVVAYVNKASFGTAMEIQYAFSKQNISIYVINPNQEYKRDIWLTYHCNMFFENVTDCADQINMIQSNIIVMDNMI